MPPGMKIGLAVNVNVARIHTELYTVPFTCSTKG